MSSELEAAGNGSRRKQEQEVRAEDARVNIKYRYRTHPAILANIPLATIQHHQQWQSQEHEHRAFGGRLVECGGNEQLLAVASAFGAKNIERQLVMDRAHWSSSSRDIANGDLLDARPLDAPLSSWRLYLEPENAPRASQLLAIGDNGFLLEPTGASGEHESENIDHSESSAVCWPFDCSPTTTAMTTVAKLETPNRCAISELKGPISGELAEFSERQLVANGEQNSSDKMQRLADELDRLADEWLSANDKLNLSYYLNEYESNSCDLSDLLANLMQDSLTKLPNSMIKYRLLGLIKQIYIEPQLHSNNLQPTTIGDHSSPSHQSGHQSPSLQLAAKQKQQLDLRLFEATVQRYLLASNVLITSCNDHPGARHQTNAAELQRKRRRQRRAAELKLSNDLANGGGGGDDDNNNNNNNNGPRLPMRNLRSLGAAELNEWRSRANGSLVYQSDSNDVNSEQEQNGNEEEEQEGRARGQVNNDETQARQILQLLTTTNGSRNQHQPPTRSITNTSSSYSHTSGRKSGDSGRGASPQRRLATTAATTTTSLGCTDAAGSGRQRHPRNSRSPMDLASHLGGDPAAYYIAANDIYSRPQHESRLAGGRLVMSADSSRLSISDPYVADYLNHQHHHHLPSTNTAAATCQAVSPESRAFSRPKAQLARHQHQNNDFRGSYYGELDVESAINCNNLYQGNEPHDDRHRQLSSATNFGQYPAAAIGDDCYCRSCSSPNKASCSGCCCQPASLLASQTDHRAMHDTTGRAQDLLAATGQPAGALAAGFRPSPARRGHEITAGRWQQASGGQLVAPIEAYHQAAATAMAVPVPSNGATGRLPMAEPSEPVERRTGGAFLQFDEADIDELGTCAAWPTQQSAGYQAASEAPAFDQLELQHHRQGNGGCRYVNNAQDPLGLARSRLVAAAPLFGTAPPQGRNSANSALAGQAPPLPPPQFLESIGARSQQQLAIVSSAPQAACGGGQPPITGARSPSQTRGQQQQYPRRHRRRRAATANGGAGAASPHYGQQQLATDRLGWQPPPPLIQLSDYHPEAASIRSPANSDDDDDDSEQANLVLVPSQARGRLPVSVAEQMNEQANNFVHQFDGPSSRSSMPGKRKPNLQVRRTLRVKIKKSKPILGIAIEGGFNVSGQLLPRIVCVHEDGAAYQCGKLRASDLILEVNGRSTVNMTHDEIAKTIANAYYQDPRAHIEFLIGESIHVQ